MLKHVLAATLRWGRLGSSRIVVIKSTRCIGRLRLARKVKADTCAKVGRRALYCVYGTLSDAAAQRQNFIITIFLSVWLGALSAPTLPGGA